MYFGSGKKRGKSTFKVTDVSDTRSKSIVNFPSCWPTPVDEEDEEVCEMADQSVDDDSGEGVWSDIDEDTDDIAPTPHQQRKERLHKNWEAIRVSLLQSSLRMEGFNPHECSEGDCDRDAITRCHDCSFGTYYCIECCDKVHRSRHQFHSPEVLKDGCWSSYKVPDRVLLDYSHSCTSKYSRCFTVVDIKGHHHEMSIICCACQTVAESLLLHGLWPATPVEPTLAFTVGLMNMALALMMECQVSLYNLLKALEFFENPLVKKRSVYQQLLDSFEEFRYHVKGRTWYSYPDENCMAKAPYCPACPKENGKLFVSVDACFGLPRKKTSGFSYRTPLSSNMFFHNQEHVDNFMTNYPTSKNVPNKDCSDFQAGSEIQSRSKYDALDETAVCGLCCKHGFPMKFLSLKGGERLGYAVYLLNDLVSSKEAGVTIHFMYDICCLFESHLKKQKRLDILSNIQLACPQFHVYGHGATCQLLYSPRRLEGWGLVDGEMLERLWSYLSLFRKMTKEMSASHREDILSDALFFLAKKLKSKIVSLLRNQSKRVTDLCNSAKMELEELQNKSPTTITDEMILEWKENEAAILKKSKADNVELGPHAWVLSYFALLQQYYLTRDNLASGTGGVQTLHLIGLMNSINERLLKMENQYKIPTRWLPSDTQYQSSLITTEAVKAKQTLDMMLVSGRRRWFLLSLKKKYTDGQAQAKRLAKSITNETSHLKKHMKKYNSSVEILNQKGHSSFNPLTWEEASDVSSSIYLINIPEDDQFPLVVKRAAVDAHTLVARCNEETHLLKEEMANVITTFYSECLMLESRLSALKSCEEYEDSNVLQGLFSVVKRELNCERLHLSTACDMFKQYCTPSLQISNYLAQFVDSEAVHEGIYEDEVSDDDDDDDFNDEDLDDLL